MKTRVACVLALLAGCAGSSAAGVAPTAPVAAAPISPDFVAGAPRLHISPSLVASPAINRIEPLDVVAFALDSAMLTSAGFDQVDRAASWLRRHPDRQIVLEGHTDLSGPDVYNEDLANRRISAVRQRLLANGIGSDRIVMISYGAHEAIEPTNPNDRRVVMFATRQAPRAVIAQQLQHRDAIVATWTDRNMLVQQRGRTVVGRR